MGRGERRNVGQWTGQLNAMRSLRRALLLTALAPALACAADKSPDPDLLEFLGSVDADGGDWSEYLERTDLDKVARPAAPAKPAAPPSPPPRPPAQEQAKPAPPPVARTPEDGK